MVMEQIDEDKIGSFNERFEEAKLELGIWFHRRLQAI